MLGLTFKENVPDLRNSRVVDIISALRDRGFVVDVHDAFADADEAEACYGLRPRATLDGANGYHCVIGAVSHEAYTKFTPDTFQGLLEDKGVVADVKGMWRHLKLPACYRRWQL